MTDTTQTTSTEPEEWETQRDAFKTSGDAHFRSASYAQAISSYASALDLDPTNHILLSNRSAAHLALGEKSKALHDARKCVESEPGWVKGHTRLGAALMALGRFDEAGRVYDKVLRELDTENDVAKRGLEECRIKERGVEWRKEEELTGKREMHHKVDAESQMHHGGNDKKESTGANDEDDLLDDFFSEVEKATEKPKESNNDTANDTPEDDSTNRIKLHLNDLGTPSSQIDRLLQTNYEWKNLNPFYVLDIPHTVDDESIISARYRALSLLVHPDKNASDATRAKAAFEQIKKAMEQMNDEDKRRHVRQLVEQGVRRGKRDWEEVERSSMTQAEKEEGLAAAQNRATMKIFAEIEVKRRDVERRKRKYEQREREQEDAEKNKEKNERDFDKKWRDTERVEKRVGNWRDFQVGNKKNG